MNILLDLVDIFVKWYSVEWWLTKFSTRSRVSRFRVTRRAAPRLLGHICPNNVLYGRHYTNGVQYVCE